MKSLVLIITAALAASAARADQPAQAYVTVAGGATHLNLDCTGASSCDKTDFGGKALAGYNFGNGFSLEGGYASFGKAGGSDGTRSLTIRPRALLVGGVFSLPLNNEWGLNARLGIARVKTKGEAWLGNVYGGSVSDTKTKVYAGLGLTYTLSPAVKLELGLDSTQVDFAGGKGNVRLISVGATFGF